MRCTAATPRRRSLDAAVQGSASIRFDRNPGIPLSKVPAGSPFGGIPPLPGFEPPQATLPTDKFEERWTGGYIFENEWQSFRTRQNRAPELMSVTHTYQKPERYTAAVKAIDIFGNDTMTPLPVNVGLLVPLHTDFDRFAGSA